MQEAIQAEADTIFQPAKKPTIYFIGMTTGKSSIMRVFPKWAKFLGLGDVAIQGIDCRWHENPAVYRRVVEFIRNDPLSQGALVTTHKIDLFKACRDLFAELDPRAEMLGEVSCISKSDGRLRGDAKDSVTSGLALKAFLPSEHWITTGGEALVLGAGGSSIAITSYLMDPRHGANRPTRIIVTNRNRPRLDEMQAIHRKIDASISVEYHLSTRPEDSDALLARLRPRSLVINATGLGKDAPGSPLTAGANFPAGGFAWDFNYRGQLMFLDQAQAQASAHALTVVDGWVYFIYGWTRVVAEVFAVDIPTSGPKFEAISCMAQEAR